MAKNEAHTLKDSPASKAATRIASGLHATKGRSGQAVSMSEEGKKRHVLGQLLSSFFSEEKTGGRLDR